MTGTIPAHWKILAYESPDGPSGFQAVAHLFEKRKDIQGRAVFSLLPATAFASTPEQASDRLRAFLQAEIGKEAKRLANADAFGERVRRRTRSVTCRQVVAESLRRGETRELP